LFELLFKGSCKDGQQRIDNCSESMAKRSTDPALFPVILP